MRRHGEHDQRPPRCARLTGGGSVITVTVAGGGDRCRTADPEPSGNNPIWPLPRRGRDRPRWCLMSAVPLDDHRLHRRGGRAGPGRWDDALHPPRMRRHPGTVGIRPPPTRSWPRGRRDRRAAPAGALPRVPSNPDSAAGHAAATPGRLHRGDRHRAGPQGRGPGTGGSPPYWAAGRPPSAAGCVTPAAPVISPGSGSAAHRNSSGSMLTRSTSSRAPATCCATP